MFCTYCGKQIDDDSRFCCHCGKEAEPMIKKVIENKPSVRNKIFAFVGFGLGITAFIFGFLPIWGIISFMFSIPGLIFSKYGMDSDKVNYAKKGKIFSNLGLIFGLSISTFFIILIGLLG